MTDKKKFDEALANMKRGTRTKAKKGRSHVTFVGKERADKLKRDA